MIHPSSSFLSAKILCLQPCNAVALFKFSFTTAERFLDRSCKLFGRSRESLSITRNSHLQDFRFLHSSHNRHPET
jgi:hypothetical protein